METCDHNIRALAPASFGSRTVLASLSRLTRHPSYRHRLMCPANWSNDVALASFSFLSSGPNAPSFIPLLYSRCTWAYCAQLLTLGQSEALGGGWRDGTEWRFSQGCSQRWYSSSSASLSLSSGWPGLMLFNINSKSKWAASSSLLNLSALLCRVGILGPESPSLLEHKWLLLFKSNFGWQQWCCGEGCSGFRGITPFHPTVRSRSLSFQSLRSFHPTVVRCNS